MGGFFSFVGVEVIQISSTHKSHQVYLAPEHLDGFDKQLGMTVIPKRF